MSLVAWGGAALFAVSLAYFLFSYEVRFAALAAPGPMAGPAIWNVILFTVFALHHSVFARDAVRRRVERLVPAALERSAYVWVASVLFVLVCVLWQPVPGTLWKVDGGWLWLLRGLQVCGVWLTLRGAAVLDIYELSGLRQVRARTGGDTMRQMEFKTTGPYGWVRHPIYAGWFLLVWAATPMTMTRFVFAAVSCAYLLAAIPLEERSLRTAGAEAYERYAQAVRWKLVPGIF